MDSLVVRRWVILGLIVTHVLKAGMPMDGKLFAGNLISNPEVMHLHGTRALEFNGVVGNPGCCGVVAVNGSGGLGVAEFVENEPNDAPFFGIDK